MNDQAFEQDHLRETEEQVGEVYGTWTLTQLMQVKGGK